MSLLEIDPQRIAADPRLSAFVTANAGSGKTKTLIDRTARLLLEKVAPEAILCVTYTKAAAAEMQRRLYEVLGGWSVAPSDKLRDDLGKLQGLDPDRFDETDLSTARALFARALETPGGLKIQTIHAFCEKLLRRFPLEAGVSPSFTVMDDPAQAAVSKAARDFVAHAALAGDGPVARAYANLSIALDFATFESTLREFEHRRGALAAYFRPCGGPEGVADDVWRACGFKSPEDPTAIAADAMMALDRRVWRDAADLLALGGPRDSGCAAKMRGVVDVADATFEDALAALFTKENTPAAWVATTTSLRSHEDLRSALLTEQDRLGEALERLRAAKVALDTIDVLTLAAAYGRAYETEKTFAGALDFADLIDRTKDLLTQRVDAAWVLFKLDGGIDHVLVDEAQDTAPEQWDILQALTAEFFAGAGAERRGPAARLGRTVFVVGDEKQSIYSFQGARPERLLEETSAFLDAIRGAGAVGESVSLTTSFRSAPPVLSFVDATFDDPAMLAGVQPANDTPLLHAAFRADHPGCVDFWPLEREIKGEEREAWDAPLDLEKATSANRRLANRIAAEVKALVARGDQVFDKHTGWRPADYGDVLILVRRRGALFEDILRALKHAEAPVAGADRLPLSEHIAFDDLMALSRFALFPEDELNLAALLKSPFCGLDDDGLYALAKPRAAVNLWQALQARGGERADWTAALGFLRWACANRATSPFEFFARALERADIDNRSARTRFLERLGSEAQDALAEFLSQTLAAEARGVRDLETHAAAFAGLDITVKREMDGARGEVRVMTTHGAKGLEAPVVILPEMAIKGGARGSGLLETEAGGFLWCSSGANDCESSAAARLRRKGREEAESLRLFYVALTRARDRLILCGRINARDDEAKIAGWYGAAKAALRHEKIAPHVRPSANGDFAFERFGDDPKTGTPRLALIGGADHPLPAWTAGPPAPEPAAMRYAAPSMLGESDEAGRGPAPSPLAAVAGLGRYRRGEIIHRLLQLLPDIAPDARLAAAERLLAAERDLTHEQRAEMASAAFAVLDDPQFAEVFGPGSRPEVAIAGGAAGLPADLAISGRIDRLVVTPDRVLVVDFKTNRPAPTRIEDADRAYRLQMAVYAAVLAELYPGRRIEAALVWTDGPKLMAVPEKVMAAALAELAGAH